MIYFVQVKLLCKHWSKSNWRPHLNIQKIYLEFFWKTWKYHGILSVWKCGNPAQRSTCMFVLYWVKMFKVPITSGRHRSRSNLPETSRELNLLYEIEFDKPCSYAHEIVTKTVHKTLPQGSGTGLGAESRGCRRVQTTWLQSKVNGCSFKPLCTHKNGLNWSTLKFH